MNSVFQVYGAHIKNPWARVSSANLGCFNLLSGQKSFEETNLYRLAICDGNAGQAAGVFNASRSLHKRGPIKTLGLVGIPASDISPMKAG
jgi:hypothetical protein